MTSSLRSQVRELRDRVSALEQLVKSSPAGVPVGGGRILTKTLYDTLLYVDACDRLIAPHLLLERVFEPEVSLLVDNIVQPGDTVVDVGANIGYYTCAFGRKVGPAGRVIAFEADPATCELLRDNVFLNYIESWTAYRNVAVSSSPGTLKLFRRKFYRGNTSIIRLHPTVLEGFGDTDEEFEVRCDSLDSLLANVDRPVSLIKIDVEGAERLVLEGMRDVVRRSPGIRVIFEWALWTIRDAGGSPRQIWDLIRGFGFKASEIGQSLRRVDLKDLEKTPMCYLLLER